MNSTRVEQTAKERERAKDSILGMFPELPYWQANYTNYGFETSLPELLNGRVDKVVEVENVGDEYFTLTFFKPKGLFRRAQKVDRYFFLLVGDVRYLYNRDTRLMRVFLRGKEVITKELEVDLNYKSIHDYHRSFRETKGFGVVEELN